MCPEPLKDSSASTCCRPRELAAFAGAFGQADGFMWPGKLMSEARGGLCSKLGSSEAPTLVLVDYTSSLVLSAEATNARSARP